MSDVPFHFRQNSGYPDNPHDTSVSPMLSPTPTSSIASQLPYDLLLQILLSVKELALEERGEYCHGGQLVGWDSNEVVAPFALVCRGWEEAAVAVLYQSVSLRGGVIARRFLATIRARPELAEMVRWLAIGLADEEEEEEEEGAEGWAAASQALVEPLFYLPNIEHLLLRPLDLSVRPDLLAWFALPNRLSLTSLVLIARSGPRWGDLLHPPDAPLIFPHLKRLDVDVNTSVVSPGLQPNPTFAPFTSLALTHLCFNSNLPASLTYPLLSPTLTTLFLYFEHLRPAREAADALARAPNLQHLRYVCNPLFEELEADYEAYAANNATPLLDLALPFLLKLETRRLVHRALFLVSRPSPSSTASHSDLRLQLAWIWSTEQSAGDDARRHGRSEGAAGARNS